ncbi:cytochrome c peroxidase [Thalassotalea ganghwensis]
MSTNQNVGIRLKRLKSIAWLSLGFSLSASAYQEVELTLDQQLAALIEQHQLTGEPDKGVNIPSPTDPEVELGKQLFFSKSLSGDKNVACATCHHPYLGGGDDLALTIGVNAQDPDVLGEQRKPIDGQYTVPRNSPTVFNSWTAMRSMFRDSRVEFVDLTDPSKGISTPDVAFNEADPNAGDSLLAAQARFPVTSTVEMLGDSFAAGLDNEAIRAHLTDRIADIGMGQGALFKNEWRERFEQVYQQQVQSGEEVVTFANIMKAIAKYEQSLNFTQNPWFDYIKGDVNALSDAQKRGAILFLTLPPRPDPNDPDPQGPPPGLVITQCVACHSGDTFDHLVGANEHRVAFPQIGPGTGAGATGTNDLGRSQRTLSAIDDFKFRSPSLLNIEVTAPYGHSGSYQTLEQVMRHYNNFHLTVNNYLDNQQWCEQPQFKDRADCVSLFPNARADSQAAMDLVLEEQANGAPILLPIGLDDQQIDDMVAFLKALTDPCVKDAECLSPWLPSRYEASPDNLTLHAKTETGVPLYLAQDCDNNDNTIANYSRLRFDQQECLSGTSKSFYVDVKHDNSLLYISTFGDAGDVSVNYHPTTWATSTNATRVANNLSSSNELLTISVNKGYHFISVSDANSFENLALVVSVDSATRDPLPQPSAIDDACSSMMPIGYSALEEGIATCIDPMGSWYYFYVAQPGTSYELRTQHGSGQLAVYTDYFWPSAQWHQFSSSNDGVDQYLRLDNLNQGWYFIKVDASNNMGSSIQLTQR